MIEQPLKLARAEQENNGQSSQQGFVAFPAR